MVQPLKFGNREVISSRTLPGVWLLIHAGLKLIHVNKSVPCSNCHEFTGKTLQYLNYYLVSRLSENCHAVPHVIIVFFLMSVFFFFFLGGGGGWGGGGVWLGVDRWSNSNKKSKSLRIWIDDLILHKITTVARNMHSSDIIWMRLKFKSIYEP